MAVLCIGVLITFYRHIKFENRNQDACELVVGVSGVEDKKLLRIVLAKSNRDAANCWRSLLEGQYAPDAYVFDQMEKKLTLERFQNEV